METLANHQEAAGGPPDGELIDRIRDHRDSAALRTLFQRYYSRVYWFVQRRLHDANLTEEVVADVFFEVWRSAGNFAGASRPSTWLFGIAHFKCVGAHRDRKRHKRSAVLPTNVEVLHRVADDRDVGERLESRDELRLVQQAIAALPEDQRRVIQLALIEGLPYDQIADQLGVPEGTVKTRVARARARLRLGLRRLGIEEERR
jgi:RNA polymerase sigma-70 factor (ECF subfamily)